jgi:CheY-like chemotaxis protein
VLRRIRSEKQTRKIPVVLLANSDEERDEKLCFSVGPTRYLVKNAGLDDYVEALKRTFQEFGKHIGKDGVPSR